MLKLFAALIIIFGFAYGGMLLSLRYKKRVAQLEELIDALNFMEFDIDFKQLHLSDSIERIGKSCKGGLRDVFLYVFDHMSKEKCTDMEKVWRKAVDRFREELFLNAEDIEILLDFSKRLGFGSKEHEKNNIKLAMAKLSIALDEARNLSKKNSKMFRGLGFLVGLFVVIVLI